MKILLRDYPILFYNEIAPFFKILENLVRSFCLIQISSRFLFFSQYILFAMIILKVQADKYSSTNLFIKILYVLIRFIFCA